MIFLYTIKIFFFYLNRFEFLWNRLLKYVSSRLQQWYDGANMVGHLKGTQKIIPENSPKPLNDYCVLIYNFLLLLTYGLLETFWGYLKNVLYEKIC